MLPLAGVRILAVEVYGAGPFGTAHLADLGAELHLWDTDRSNRHAFDVSQAREQSQAICYIAPVMAR